VSVPVIVGCTCTPVYVGFVGLTANVTASKPAWAMLKLPLSSPAKLPVPLTV
jgi:hypothetical protein